MVLENIKEEIARRTLLFLSRLGHAKTITTIVVSMTTSDKGHTN
jgi:hypothetical protein